jgi:phage virion morphogenesis protein
MTRFINVSVSDNVTGGLRALSEKLNNMQIVYEDIGTHLLTSHKDRWEAQESPEGQGWQPLSDKYLQSPKKRQSRGRNQILVLNEYLREGLRYQASDTTLEFGTDSEYGARQHFGGGGIPARPWLGISAEDETEISAILSDWLSGAF